MQMYQLKANKQLPVLAMVMCGQSVSVCDIIIQSKCSWPWPWPWPLEWAKVKCKYANRKPINVFLCFGKNVCPICHRLGVIDVKSTPKWTLSESLITNRWITLCGLQHGENKAHLSQTIFLWSTNDLNIHTDTHTQTHTLTIAIGKNINLLHFAYNAISNNAIKITGNRVL